ncbi:hypothetical protein KAW50_02620 [candidate division WOR-3 bacterium]|nr:hypothetical protein [candidate division WOR-3 bacterium]
MIDPISYRVFPAPLMGTKFATGRTAYSNLDFWQVGAMTDFTKGINQKFLVDPSAYYLSNGIDISKEGEFKLERDLETQALPGGTTGYITARYRSINTLWLGTSTGLILKSTDGNSFTIDQNTTAGQIYNFYEISSKLFATKGGNNNWVRASDDNWYECVQTYNTGTATFINGSVIVTGVGTSWNKGMQGRRIRYDADGTWYTISVVVSTTSLTLTAAYDDAGGGPGIYTIGSESFLNLYYVMVESDYANGIFNDGVRQSSDGFIWLPEPPDPLWELPSSEGTALNAIPIPRGFLIGSKRGLWIFVGGGSGINIWLFPDYASADNFKGMEKFGVYGVFSIENQGIFYTDGSGVFPTNLNWRGEGVKITTCKSILSSGWEMLALVGDGTDWYLARCSMINTRVPKHWWFVKTLTKTPAYLSAYSRDRVFIHYADGTCEKYNKIDGPYQSSGYLQTSWIDENLILLQKLYKSLTSLFETFPTDTDITLYFKLKEAGSWTSKSFVGKTTGANSKDFDLENPTLGQRIMIKIQLETSDTTKTPIVTDLCWKYILERPTDDVDRKKTWHFQIFAEDELEKLDFDKEELGLSEPRTRQDLLNSIWASRNKKQLLNYVGADNENKRAFTIQYTGSGASCLLEIDRTNYRITLKVDGVTDQILDYEGQKIRDIVLTINGWANYKCFKDKGVPQNQLADDLVPTKNLEVKGRAIIYYGTDVHAVLFNPTSPGQYKITFGGEGGGRGSDRLNISLREA